MTETSDHEHSHQHSAGHEHPTQPDQDDSITYFKAMEAAVRDLLIEKDLITAEQIREKIEQMDARVPANGAKIIAKSWVDEEFKRKLIANPRKAISEFGHDIGPLHLIVLENTEKVHNVVVCTLCSCYPRWILGLPPDWYKSREYRSRVVRESLEKYYKNLVLIFHLTEKFGCMTQPLICVTWFSPCVPKDRKE